MYNHEKEMKRAESISNNLQIDEDLALEREAEQRDLAKTSEKEERRALSIRMNDEWEEECVLAEEERLAPLREEIEKERQREDLMAQMEAQRYQEWVREQEEILNSDKE